MNKDREQIIDKCLNNLKNCVDTIGSCTNDGNILLGSHEISVLTLANQLAIICALMAILTDMKEDDTE
jgi:nitrogen-specific signal transduction histidine kinase